MANIIVSGKLPHCKLMENIAIEGGFLIDAINEGVRKGYAAGYLRKSICCPIFRKSDKQKSTIIRQYFAAAGLCSFKKKTGCAKI